MIDTINTITGIILAGGTSSRMGQDKGLLIWKNQTFTEHIIEALGPIVSDLIIISNSEEYKRFGFPVYQDLLKDRGPLGGIYTGLAYSETYRNIIISCDVPLVTSSTLQQLIVHDEDEYDIIQLSNGSRTMPLVAMYKKSCESPFLARLEQDKLKLQAAVSAMKVKTLALPDDEKFTLTNVNTREDLKNLRYGDNS